MEMARYFAHGTTAIWKFADKSKCLDWTKLKDLYDKEKYDSDHQLRLGDIIIDHNGDEVTFKDLKPDTSIFCPVCGEDEHRSNTGQHNAVKLIKSNGLPFIHCSSCKSRNMGYKRKGNYYLHSNDGYEIKSKENNAIVFIDTLKCKFLSGCEENGMDDFVIRDISNEYHARQFCESHELPIPKHFMRARYELLFDRNDRTNFEEGYVNKYAPSKYLSNPIPESYSPEMPKYIGKIIDHVLGFDKEITKRFINDMADFIQTRKKRRTAFLFQGTEGTGKGFLFTVVFNNIFGSDYCSQTDMHAFKGQFNSFLESNVYVLVNEISGNFSSHNENMSTIEKIKIAITDEVIQIEGKGKDRYNGKNNCSFVFASNRDNALVIPIDDRRFNVAPKQEEKIHETEWWLCDDTMEKMVLSELQGFVWYLKSYSVDKSIVNRVIDNEAKRILQTLSMSNADLFFNALKTGDYDWFLENFIEDNWNININKAKAVRNALGTPDSNGYVIIKSGDLCVLYNHMNSKSLTPQGFGKLATAKLGEAKPHRSGKKVIHGFKLTFTYPPGHTIDTPPEKDQESSKLFD